ncbi:hypothetical protein DOX23_21245 [Salmonella enterica subsp. enterica]|uniref:Uncharacterized protein n=1 Tax=Salmonella enteritidis TaxID=149539 RepID=A0A5V0B8J4_SALEN|nr:hypothetical protein [Salmonella enterica subsp. enterica serovar Enteritidis]ECG1480682.1 hypothetical protein [Salmonella enterica subsp. enterica]EDQ7128174.1 hypothetical protein [Salmonella enterica subsp. enterica serovar Fischerhuette]EEC6742581.1 hypothetical protein [Salmonella enterica subsp. enterica serovar Telelkebir]EEL6777010.1 hypothetical protein [Salmonella enterica subsp. enterica serovar Kingston]EJH8000296.1 hypothetical protein [Salmonella enterica]MJW51756.1 hypothet
MNEDLRFPFKYRKDIFDLYKDTFVCIAIAVLGIYLLKIKYYYLGYFIYITAAMLFLLAIVTTVRGINRDLKSKKINSFKFIIMLTLILFSILILSFGILKSANEFLGLI